MDILFPFGIGVVSGIVFFRVYKMWKRVHDFRKDMEKRRLEIAQEQIRQAWEERIRRLLHTQTIPANARSRETLLRFLTPEQREQFSGERGSSFTTTAPSGHKWEIRWGGVDLLDDNGERIRSYCYEPEEHGLPVYDQMLARKLMIEHHEEQVLRDGNVVYDRGVPPRRYTENITTNRIVINDE